MAEKPSPTISPAAPILRFVPFQSLVDEGFWFRLSSLKLDALGIDDSPIPITGFYAPCARAQVPNYFTLLAESLPDASDSQLSLQEGGHGNRNRCPVPGTLYNMNTLEAFNSLDRNSLLKMEAKKILEDICSGKVEENSALLSRFLVISFADLKSWRFRYWFMFPALVLDPPATVVSLHPASHVLSIEEAESLTAACNKWRNSSLTTDAPFFLVSITSDSCATLLPLKDWEACQGDERKLFFGFYDPCNHPNNPVWPLRNFLAFISLRWKLENVRFLCYREKHGVADLGLSLIGEALISIPQGTVADDGLTGWGDPEAVPNAVGWERNKDKLVPRCVSLAGSMDPERLAVSAADLNLKLMRWRALPSLNLSILSAVKCLLIGAGTLGCDVARNLMRWGVRKITLVDSGRVAMSNPIRQSLYTHEDCLNGGELKAVAAARSLKRIFPAAETDGIALAVPMLGHPVSSQEEVGVLEDCKNLQTLIASHDVVFLLTDTRESRWLPTLICASENKIAINAALGFDSFLVMRHGAGPLISGPDLISGIKAEDDSIVAMPMGGSSMGDGESDRRLGCYFCNDVVAPIDSTSNRTLDQQCTVTLPALAPMASSLAVQLMVGIMHHPNGIYAPGENADSVTSSSERPLGILPHQIRYFLPNFSQFTLLGYSSSSCTACSNAVVSEYRRRGLEFVLDVINHPTYLEDLTGLTELMKSATLFDVDWDNETDDIGDV